MKERFLEDGKSISEVLKSYTKGAKIDQKMLEFALMEQWESIVGKMISKHTTELELKGTTLYISIDSSPLKQELMYHRSTLISKINRYFSGPIVRRFLSNLSS
jgi:predicted nucleic acid-binding Zn ribbon protein